MVRSLKRVLVGFARRVVVPAWGALAMGGCFSSDLDAFNVLGLDLQGTKGPITLRGMTDDAYVNSATVEAFTLGGSCADEGRQIRLSLASGEVPEVLPVCSNGAWSSGPLDLSGASEGELDFTASWADDPSVSASLTLTKDTHPPTISLATLTSADTLRGNATQNIEWSITDPDLPSSAVSIAFEDSGDWTPVASGLNPAAGSYAWTVPVRNGTGYRIRVRAVDRAGNVGETMSASFEIDSLGPKVTITREAGQADPTNNAIIEFRVTFSEPIDPDSFNRSDITQTGSAPGVSWGEVEHVTGNTDFLIRTTAVSGDGTVAPSIAAGRVSDAVGNLNEASTGTDSTVIYDVTGPTAAIFRKMGQAEDVKEFPIEFEVRFNETIVASSFDISDILQAGTATNVAWEIEPTEDGRIFVLKATSAGSDGTVIPELATGAVQDEAGNINLSAVTGQSVNYDTTPPVVTIETPSMPAGYINSESVTAYPVNGECAPSDGPVTLSVEDPSPFTSTIPNAAECTEPGKWSYVFEGEFSLSSRPESSLTIRAEQTDAAGNTGRADLNVTKDTIPPIEGQLTWYINDADEKTKSPSLTLVADAAESNADRYVTEDPACEWGGSWAPSNDTGFPWYITNFRPHVHHLYAKFRDAAGNETECLERSIELEVLYPEHVYPAYSLWNDYVDVVNPEYPLHLQSPVNACTTSKAGREGCVHSGAFLKVETDEDSCNGIRLQDNLGAFVWNCDDSTGKAVFRTAGFAPGKGLGDLIDFNGGTPDFREMYVLILDGETSRNISVARRWWANPIMPIVSTASTTPISLTAAHTVYVVGPGSETTGPQLTISGAGISLVVLPGGSYMRNPSNPNSDNVVSLTGTANFGWIEGTFGSLGEAFQNGILISGAARVTLNRARIIGGPATADSTARTGIAISNGHSHLLRDVEIQRVRSASSNSAGILISNSPENVLDYVSVAEGPESNLSGCILLKNNSSGTRMRGIRASNCYHGIHIITEAGNTLQATVIQEAVISHMTGAGIRIEAYDTTSVTGTKILAATISHSNIGIQLESTPTGTFIHQVVLQSNNKGIRINGSSTGTTISEAAMYDNPGAAIEFAQAGATAKGTGTLITNAGAASCAVQSASANGFAANCEPAGMRSNHEMNSVTSAQMINSFYGMLLPGLDDFKFGGYTFQFTSTFENWLSFDSIFRTAGAAGFEGRCNSTNSTCGIFDWRLRVDDDQLLNRSVDRAKGEGPLVDPSKFGNAGACPITGDDILTAFDDSGYYRHALEVLFDRAGNEDGICQAGETCYFTPNFGAYQGHGPLKRAQCTVQDGTLEGIKLLVRSNNGIPYEATTPPDDGPRSSL